MLTYLPFCTYQKVIPYGVTIVGAVVGGNPLKTFWDSQVANWAAMELSIILRLPALRTVPETESLTELASVALTPEATSIALPSL